MVISWKFEVNYEQALALRYFKKFVDGWVAGWVGGWVAGWVGGWFLLRLKISRADQYIHVWLSLNEIDWVWLRLTEVARHWLKPPTHPASHPPSQPATLSDTLSTFSGFLTYLCNLSIHGQTKFRFGQKTFRYRFRMANIWIISEDRKIFPQL